MYPPESFHNSRKEKPSRRRWQYATATHGGKTRAFLSSLRMKQRSSQHQSGTCEIPKTAVWEGSCSCKRVLYMFKVKETSRYYTRWSTSSCTLEEKQRSMGVLDDVMTASDIIFHWYHRPFLCAKIICKLFGTSLFIKEYLYLRVLSKNYSCLITQQIMPESIKVTRLRITRPTYSNYKS